MKSCIIIGGGVTGLTAGVYAAASGYRTTVLERHDEPGGVCTAWDRGGYTFDLCLHWLMGTAPGDQMRSRYAEIGALDQVELIPIDTFARVVDEATGLELAYGPDLARLVRDVEAISPTDAPHFRELAEVAMTVADVDFSPAEYEGMGDAIRRTWSYRGFPWLFARWGLTNAEWSRRLRHPGLRGLFEAFGSGDMPMAVLAIQLGQLAGGHMSGARSRPGFAPGASRGFARGIAERFRSLGGALRLGAEVEEILVEADRAVGVRLADGEELRADHLISTAPLHTTLWRLLGGRYLGREWEHRFTRWRLFDPVLVVDVGCDRAWDVPMGSIALRNCRPFEVLGRSATSLGARAFVHDPLVAPAGHSVVQALVTADWDAWQELHHAPRAYTRAKDTAARQVIASLERQFPGIGDAARVVDVATPFTFWRYTRAWRGSYEGWWPSMEAVRARFDHRLPGLSGLWLAGQWLAAGGGLPPAVAQGRDAVRAMCAEDRVPFGTPGAPAEPVADRPDGTSPAEVAEGAFGALAMLLAMVTPMLQEARSHWGLSADEAGRARPGDAVVAEPRWSWTHAVEVEAPAATAWAWMAQLGQSRGGFYSYEALENLVGCDVHNAERLLPEFQQVAVGDPFRLHPEGPPLRVVEVEPGRHFVVATRVDLETGEAVPDGGPLPPRALATSWAFVVEPLGDTRCRVVSRFRITWPDELRYRLTLGRGLLEPVGFVMDRRMLLGIKERAEATRPLPHFSVADAR